MNPLLPPPLRAGDTIGVFAPSSTASASHPRRFARAVGELEHLGYRVRLAEGVNSSSERPEMRGAQINELVADDSVTALLATIGGNNTNAVLDHVDWDALRRTPKLVIGYSDLTALFGGMWSTVGLGGVAGPLLLPQFGEFGGCDKYTVDSLRRIVRNPEPAGVILPSGRQVDELLRWDEQDDRPRQSQVVAPPRTLAPGHAEGTMIAANLETLLRLAGTRWWPDLVGALLFVEEAEHISPSVLCAHLTQLRQIGVLDVITGLGFGRFDRATTLGAAPMLLSEIVAESTKGFTGPIVADLDFGHTDPMCALPWGVAARLDADRQVRLELLEAAVGPPRPSTPGEPT